MTRLHDARLDYCRCAQCAAARSESMHRVWAAEAEAARFIPVADLYRWIRREAS
jgi:hypothetical protein